MIAGLQEKGLKVPEDISVLGFDNISSAAYFNVPLTTIDVPLNQMMDLALAAILEKKRIKHNTILPAQLIIRSSVCKPKKRSKKQWLD